MSDKADIQLDARGKADMQTPTQGLQDLGAKIRAARARARMTQVTLCERAGVSRDTLSRLERGEPVDTSTLMKILSALGLHVEFVRRHLRAGDMRRKYADMHEEAE
jgi:transcriptional regulator with XRE-family HTH domain